MRSAVITLALVLATPVAFADAPYSKQVAELVRPSTSIKAPTIGVKVPTGTLCGVPANATLDTVIMSWGVPSAFTWSSSASLELHYGTTRFYLGGRKKQRGHIRSCTLRPTVAGLEKAGLAGVNVHLGQSVDDAKKALGGLVEQAFSDSLRLKPNKHALRTIAFDTTTKIVNGLQFSVLTVPGYKRPTAAAPMTLPWATKAAALIAYPSRMPDTKPLQWSKKGDRAVGLSKGARGPDDVAKVFGKPVSVAMDPKTGAISKLTYNFGSRNHMFFRWTTPGKLHVGVDPGNGSVLRNLSILPKGFTSGDRFEKIRKAFGEPDYEVKESDNGMLIYKKLDDGLELSLNFEPNSEKGPLGLSNYDLWLPLK